MLARSDQGHGTRVLKASNERSGKGSRQRKVLSREAGSARRVATSGRRRCRDGNDIASLQINRGISPRLRSGNVELIVLRKQRRVGNAY